MVGRSRQPRMLSSVDLPEPDGPMIETVVAVRDRQVDSAQRVDRSAADLEVRGRLPDSSITEPSPLDRDARPLLDLGAVERHDDGVARRRVPCASSANCQFFRPSSTGRLSSRLPSRDHEHRSPSRIGVARDPQDAVPGGEDHLDVGGGPGRSSRANAASSSSASISKMRFCSWTSWTYGATRVTCPAKAIGPGRRRA